MHVTVHCQPELHYRVQIQPDACDVTVGVKPGNSDSGPFLFFTGQVNAAHFSCDKGIQIHRDDRLIQCDVPDNEAFELHYQVQLGKFVKHGHQGYSCADFVMFGGEQLFIIPASGVAQRIRTEFYFPAEMQAVLPAPARMRRLGQAETVCVENSWRGVYSLMKNNYAFGHFELLKSDGITVALLKSESGNQTPIMAGVAALEKYFTHFLPDAAAPFFLTLLPQTATGESVIGGVGPGSAGFSFSAAQKRDWQLLGHRLFHGCYDRAVGVQELHLPGQLWLLEGLATWSELESTALLPGTVTSAWSEKRRTVMAELAALYRRYLYFRFKDPELFDGPSMADADSQQAGTREFLHYTQAPLIVAALAARMSSENSWGKWLQELPRHRMGEMAASILRLLPPESRETAREWLDLAAPLNLFDYFSRHGESDLGDSAADILVELEEFEYVLWTWFLKFPGTFVQHSIFPEQFERAVRAAQKYPVAFAGEKIQTQLQKFSPTVFQALQMHFLRLRVCGIAPEDPLRNRKLEQPAALAQWHDFLVNLPD